MQEVSDRDLLVASGIEVNWFVGMDFNAFFVVVLDSVSFYFDYLGFDYFD